MLIKLQPDQISRWWDTIEWSIDRGLSPVSYSSPDTMTNIMKALLSDEMQCWAVVNKDNGTVGIDGVIVTTITSDKFSAIRNLLIYVMGRFSVEANPNDLLLNKDTIRVLRDYARSQRCHRVIGYTDSPRVAGAVRKVLGGNTMHTLVIVAV